MLHLEGNLLAMGHLSAPEKLPHQAPTDFGLGATDSLRTEIEHAFAMAGNQWKVFAMQRNKKHKKNSGNAALVYWCDLLFDVLGYGTLQPHPGSGIPYHYTTQNAGGGPNCPESFTIMICPHTQGLEAPIPLTTHGTTTPGNSTPYTLLQRYLNDNQDEHLWGLLCNGTHLRLLRQSGKVGRPRFVEWDLQQIMEENRYDQFAALYRILHATRMPKNAAKGPNSPIEKYHQTTIDEGLRVLDRLSNSLQQALDILGNAFIMHPHNQALKTQLDSKALSQKEYYDKLLIIMYRLVFLIVAEERQLIYNHSFSDPLNTYQQYYSILQFRSRCEQSHLEDERYHDQWQAVLSTFNIFLDKYNEEEEQLLYKLIGTKPIGSELFAKDELTLFEHCRVDNRSLMQFLDNVFHFKDQGNNRQRINYGLLDVEELGSVYEHLIELRPYYHGGKFSLRPMAGNQRKTTASYYTPPKLVNCLIESARCQYLKKGFVVKKVHKHKKLPYWQFGSVTLPWAAAAF